MEKKRKNSGFSDEFDFDGEAEDLEYDLRLVRRWKRSCIATKDIQLNSAGKNSFHDEGNYSEASKDIVEANSVNLDIDDDDNEIFVDAEYKKHLDSLSSRLTGDDSVPNHRTFDSGDDVNMLMQTANKVNSLESNRIEMGGNRGDIVDASYLSYLDILARKTDVKMDLQTSQGKSGEKLVGNKLWTLMLMMMLIILMGRRENPIARIMLLRIRRMVFLSRGRTTHACKCCRLKKVHLVRF